MDDDIFDVMEWIRYAQEDYDAAVAMAATNNPYAPRKACYDCHQSAEKILKAYIIAKEGTRKKEHNLVTLLKQCSQYSHDFDGLRAACLILNTHIAKTRYPSGKKLTDSDMEEALGEAAKILELTKSKLTEMGFGS
ncbi:MAG: HEPN domain-containing protein [Chitinispirillales bacterium]|jgi:HEPN domain-containing protein|nr:HEPN domain-containing protein [Chitinispirillales bacterium]